MLDRNGDYNYAGRSPGDLVSRVVTLRLPLAATGAADPAVAAYWRDHYDVAHRIVADRPRLRKDLNGKLHVTVGAADSYGLDRSVRRLEAAFPAVGGHADFTYVPGARHSMKQVCAWDGDGDGLWKEITQAMLAIAQPPAGAVGSRR